MTTEASGPAPTARPFSIITVLDVFEKVWDGILSEDVPESIRDEWENLAWDIERGSDDAGKLVDRWCELEFGDA